MKVPSVAMPPGKKLGWGLSDAALHPPPGVPPVGIGGQAVAPGFRPLGSRITETPLPPSSPTYRSVPNITRLLTPLLSLVSPTQAVAGGGVGVLGEVGPLYPTPPF